MTLEKRIQTIDEPIQILEPYAAGNAVSIKQFWNDFVKCRLPDPVLAVKWFHFLKKYVNDTNFNPVLAVRTYGNWLDSKVKDTKTLRRGFYNTTDAGFSFFYSDNFFAAYFAKLTLLGVDPENYYDEFVYLMKSRKFPARFALSMEKHKDKISGKRIKCDEETDRAAYCIDGPNPGFVDPVSKFYIAHIFDAGKNYDINGKKTDIKMIADKIGGRGQYSDWILKTDEYGSYYVRDLKGMKNCIKGCDTKELFKSIFLRYTCPMNYVLTPTTISHIWDTYDSKGNFKRGMYKNIGECEEFLEYAKVQLRTYYGQDDKGNYYFDEFQKCINYYPNMKKIDASGDKVVNIEYCIGNHSKNKNTENNKGNSNTVSNTKKLTTYTYNGNVYNQRQLCLEILKDYVKQNPDITIDQLKQVWNFKGMRRAILNENELNAEQIKRKRYHLGNNNKLFLVDKSVAVVSTQWTETIVDDFIEIAKKMGFEIQKNKLSE